MGWPAPTLRDGRPDHPKRAAFIKRMNTVIAKDPELYTMRNLQLAIEYCRRKQIEIATPTLLFGHVKEALELANTDNRPTDVEADRQAAIDYEVQAQHADSDFWIGRLTRAQGPGLFVALTAWRANRNLQNEGN